MAKLSENELAEWENKRDLNAELMQALQDMVYLKHHLPSFWVFLYARFKSGSKGGKFHLEQPQRS